MLANRKFWVTNRRAGVVKQFKPLWQRQKKRYVPRRKSFWIWKAKQAKANRLIRIQHQKYGEWLSRKLQYLNLIRNLWYLKYCYIKYQKLKLLKKKLKSKNKKIKLIIKSRKGRIKYSKRKYGKFYLSFELWKKKIGNKVLNFPNWKKLNWVDKLPDRKLYYDRSKVFVFKGMYQKIKKKEKLSPIFSKVLQKSRKRQWWKFLQKRYIQKFIKLKKFLKFIWKNKFIKAPGIKARRFRKKKIIYNLRYLVTRLLFVRKIFRHSGIGRLPFKGTKQKKKAYIAAYSVIKRGKKKIRHKVHLYPKRWKFWRSRKWNKWFKRTLAYNKPLAKRFWSFKLRSRFKQAIATRKCWTLGHRFRGYIQVYNINAASFYIKAGILRAYPRAKRLALDNRILVNFKAAKEMAGINLWDHIHIDARLLSYTRKTLWWLGKSRRRKRYKIFKRTLFDRISHVVWRDIQISRPKLFNFYYHRNMLR